MEKKCCDCNKTLNITEFDLHKSKRPTLGYRRRCRKCNKIYTSKYYHLTRELKPGGRIEQMNLVLQGNKRCTVCKEIKTIAGNFYVAPSTGKVEPKCKKCMVGYRLKMKPLLDKTILRNELHQRRLKLCSGCNEIKSYDEYNKNKKSFRGIGSHCKKCKSLKDQKYRNDPRFKDVLLVKKKEYYKKVRDTDHYQNYQKERNMNRNYKAEYERMMKDENRRLKTSLRKRIHSYFKQNKQLVRPNTETFKLLGADFFTVKEFIERQFLPGMTWANYGQWHLDHVIPLDAAGKNIDIMTRLCYYQNLTPMWGKDNLNKSYFVPNICTLWSNPIVPYKEMEIVVIPKNSGIVGRYRELTPKGKRFGRLTIIDEGKDRIYKSGIVRRTMLCKCDCGNEKTIPYQSLKRGDSKSCGCYYKETRVFTIRALNINKLISNEE